MLSRVQTMFAYVKTHSTPAPFLSKTNSDQIRGGFRMGQPAEKNLSTTTINNPEVNHNEITAKDFF
jgi:hypothetical protein